MLRFILLLLDSLVFKFFPTVRRLFGSREDGREQIDNGAGKGRSDEHAEVIQVGEIRSCGRTRWIRVLLSSAPCSISEWT